ncbi:uncharacterized protein [Rutidosis leptorrhynchoides]|uniref:uncharacterized protein n=1 Tax=Rutidosis leptorrhynchoides TaxID=125765 RepID=UPI003A9909F9
MSIWDIGLNASDSWGWKNILSLRDQVKNLVFWLIGNGKSVSAWFDCWSELGQLSDMISNRDLYEARFPLDMKVAGLIDHGQWIWTQEIIGKYPILTSLNVPILSDKEDKAVWVTSDNKQVQFSSKQAWIDLRDNIPCVFWHKVVWFSHFNPKHAFILWLALHNKLTTQDKIVKWYPHKHFSCVFCSQQVDSHEHLFFKCDYSHKVWVIIKKKLLFKGIGYDLQSIILNIAKYPSLKNKWNVVSRLLIAAVVYHIWLERNRRVFGSPGRSSDAICEQIAGCIKLKLTSLKVKNTKNVAAVAKVWNLKWNGISLTM